MTKALLKKQILEVFSWVYRDKKTQKKRSKNGIILVALLYIFLFGMLMFMFSAFATVLCDSLLQANFGWLYFAIMGIVAVAFGVFGSVFSTYSSLYKAKDNDFLLSMPVPSAKILFVRLFGVYLMGLMYELIVMIPTVVVWFVFAKLSIVSVIFTVLIPFVLSFFILSLSAILGWIVALISGKINNKIAKNIMTVMFSLAFLAVYYYFFMAKSSSLFESILSNPDALSGGVINYMYPLYQMGLAAGGEVIPMLIFTAIIAVLFAMVYLVISRSFLRLATVNKGSAKKEYKAKQNAVHSVGKTLLIKEFRHLVGSATYMLNCGLGSVLMIMAAVALLIKGAAVTEFINQILPDVKDMISLVAIAAICLVCATNNFTAPSVSLEGKNIWLLQSMPVLSKQVLTAKMNMQLILTLIPAAILIAATEFVLAPSIAFAVIIPVFVAIFIVFMAEVGLIINLKMPNLDWTNETVPVKQSGSVVISLFGGWALITVLAVVYWLLASFLTPIVYALIIMAAMLAAAVLMYKWICTKGARIFDTL